MKRKMPRQKPGLSEQSVGTHPEFLRSVRGFLKIEDFEIDLAADRQNRVTGRYFSKRDDALTKDWAGQVSWTKSDYSWAWLNPEFGKIAPWVRKAAEEKERGAQIAVLVPASVGSNWWRDYVHEVAAVLFLNGRLTFVGHDKPYPKDLALLLYSLNWEPGYNVWDWRQE